MSPSGGVEATHSGRKKKSSRNGAKMQIKKHIQGHAPKLFVWRSWRRHHVATCRQCKVVPGASIVICRSHSAVVDIRQQVRDSLL
jgi:hypothetical protein